VGGRKKNFFWLKMKGKGGCGLVEGVGGGGGGGWQVQLFKPKISPN